MTIPTYLDPLAESTVRLGTSGKQPVLVSTTCDVEVVLQNGFDNQRQKAKNFGRVRFLGIDLARVTLDFVVMPDEETSFWRNVVPICRQKGPKGNAPPVDIINPQANRAGITTVTVLRIKIGPPSSRNGRRVSIELQEWAKAPVEPKPSDAAKTKFDPPGVETTIAGMAAKS